VNYGKKTLTDHLINVISFSERMYMKKPTFNWRMIIIAAGSLSMTNCRLFDWNRRENEDLEPGDRVGTAAEQGRQDALQNAMKQTPPPQNIIKPGCGH
jgi:hypothetical protein